MSSRLIHVASSRTLRHWTIDADEFVGDLQRPAPAPRFSEESADGPSHRLAVELARFKSTKLRTV